MPKGYIEAQNGVQLEIVDATARADVTTAKSQIAKFVSPSGALEISENGTFDVKRFAQAIVNVVSSGSDGDSGEDAGSSNMWLGLYTVAEDIKTSETGWSLDIPHGLGVVPDWAVVLRTSYRDSTAEVGGWLGYTGVNMVFNNSRTMTPYNHTAPNKVSLQDEAALYLYAKSDVLTCKTPNWGGDLFAGTVLMVAVGLNGGEGDA